MRVQHALVELLALGLVNMALTSGATYCTTAEQLINNKAFCQKVAKQSLIGLRIAPMIEMR